MDSILIYYFPVDCYMDFNRSPMNFIGFNYISDLVHMNFIGFQRNCYGHDWNCLGFQRVSYGIHWIYYGIHG